jgi:hypothetical protein
MITLSRNTGLNTKNPPFDKQVDKPSGLSLQAKNLQTSNVTNVAKLVTFNQTAPKQGTEHEQQLLI